MGQTTEQIENFIENKRDDLGANLNELGDKVNSMTDWKQQFQARPMAMIGLAFGGGVLLAAMMGGSRNRRSPLFTQENELAGTAAKSPSELKQAARETWGHVKGALMGVATAKATDFIEEVVPGFREHFDRAQRA